MPTLDWIGKSKVVNHHLDVPYKTLERQYSFDKVGEHKEDNGSGNMIIHGDNLEALKSLLPQYEGKIKCIYIDPPYNRGNKKDKKWVYSDNVDDPKISEWIGQTVGAEGEDLARHDKWLCMMYPRLKLLWKLLSNHGFIAISIDNVEVFNLKLICDEIFGSNNFITEISCINNPKGRSDDKYVATAHEHILLYKKGTISFGEFELEEKVTKRYREIDENGDRYRTIDLRKTGDEDLRTDREDMFYPFFFNEANGDLIVGNNEESTPNGYIRILPMKTKKIEGRWRWGKNDKSMQDGFKNLVARYMPNKQKWTIFEKDYLKNKKGVKPTTVWDFKDVNSERGTEQFISLGFNKSDFPNPKPVGTINRIITMMNDKNAISDLRILFQTADLVKFAKHNPLMNENDANLINAIDFINETKEKEDENAKPQPTEITIIEKRSLRTKILLGAGIVALTAALVGSLIYIGLELYNYFA